MEYWESACQTIYDVAAALNIPLEEQPSKRRPLKPDSLTLLDTVDVKLTGRRLSRPLGRLPAWLGTA